MQTPETEIPKDLAETISGPQGLAAYDLTAPAKDLEISGIEAQPPMPKYRSHKEVRALAIDRVEMQEDAEDPPLIYFLDDRFEPVAAEPNMFARYTPVHGDFYVVYSDGYKSICPRAEFEGGYSSIAPAAGPERMLKFFAYGHLRPLLQTVSKPFSELAARIVDITPPGLMRTTSLLHLLSAKDAAVRAVAMPD